MKIWPTVLGVTALGVNTLGVVAPLVIVVPTHAISSAEVAKIAKGVTVSIKTPGEQGSGAIIGRNGNTYTVLTAAHVVKKTGRKYTVEINNQTYAATNIKLSPDKNLDLAVLQFQSDRVYSVIKIGNSSTVEEGSPAYVAGFPFTTAAITQTVYIFSDGKITANSSKPFANGYSIVYNCNTLPGMSGGPVLNEQGELIAIHGKGDSQEQVKQSEVNSGVWVKTGFNLGIPVNTFVQIAGQMGVNLGGTARVATARSTTADDFFVTAANQFRQGDYPGAIANLDRAIAARPNYTAAYIARAEANLYLDNGDELLRDANLALKYDPNSDEAYALRGAGKSSAGDVPGAFADFAKAISINPRSARSYLYRGFTEIQYSDPQKALKSLNQALKIDPNMSDGYSIRAVARYLIGDQQGSNADFSKALQINPSSFLAYAYRGFLRVIAGNKTPGIADINKAINISPKNPLGYLLSGQAHAQTGDNTQALKQFDRAIALKDNYDNAYANRGILYISLKNLPQALADLEKALKINPNNDTAYQGRAIYYIYQKQFDQSLADANRAIAINPASPDSWALQGFAYIGLNDRPKAKVSLQKAVKLYELRNNRGEAYKTVKDILKIL
jgi:tetratricopeptide (TPR) repeat protein